MIELNERVYELLKRQMANVRRVQRTPSRNVKSHPFEIISSLPHLFHSIRLLQQHILLERSSQLWILVNDEK